MKINKKIVTLLEYIASSRDKGMKLKSTIENAVSKNLWILGRLLLVRVKKKTSVIDMWFKIQIKIDKWEDHSSLYLLKVEINDYIIKKLSFF